VSGVEAFDRLHAVAPVVTVVILEPIDIGLEAVSDVPDIPVAGVLVGHRLRECGLKGAEAEGRDSGAGEHRAA
jgi:hypothetical protein